MNRHVLISFVALFSLVNGPAIQGAENDEHDGLRPKPYGAVGQWQLSIEHQRGLFTDCSALAIAPDYQSGINFFWVTLTNFSWQFDEKPFLVRLLVDGHDLGVWTMNPTEAVSGYIDLIGDRGSDRKTQMAIEAGSELEAIIGSDTKTFSLKDVNKAFGELLDCWMTATGHRGR
jgi:hypothetical protein